MKNILLSFIFKVSMEDYQNLSLVFIFFILGYLKDVVPRGKRPKRPFVFTRDRLDRTLAQRTQRMFWHEPSLLFGSLNSVYWFSEYLEQSGNLEPAEGERVRQWCRELHGIALKMLKKELVTHYFAEFPLAETWSRIFPNSGSGSLWGLEDEPSGGTIQLLLHLPAGGQDHIPDGHGSPGELYGFFHDPQKP